MNNLETIKNISLSLVSVVASVGLFIFYIKIYLNVGKIKTINKEIEEKYARLDESEINNRKGIVDETTINFNGKKTKLKQQIKKWQREKNYLLEEISIYKIFKK